MYPSLHLQQIECHKEWNPQPLIYLFPLHRVTFTVKHYTYIILLKNLIKYVCIADFLYPIFFIFNIKSSPIFENIPF